MLSVSVVGRLQWDASDNNVHNLKNVVFSSILMQEYTSGKTILHLILF